MEMKIKENVNHKSFTFRKRVIGEALDLIGRKRNYITNDVYFITMIAFVNNMVEDDIIIEALYDSDKLEEKITDMIEPIFDEKVLGDEETKQSFYEICEDIIDYIDRDVYFRQSIAGFLYDLTEDIGELDLPSIGSMIAEVAKLVKNQTTELNKVVKTNKETKTDAEIRDEALDSIDNVKMKALIESFTRKEGAQPPKEENKVENTAK